MSALKKPSGGVAKVIADIAGFVFLVAPVTTKHRLEIGGAAPAVFILSGGVPLWAKREKHKPEDSDA